MGCIDSDGDDDCDTASGTFHTTYTFTAKLDPDTFVELHGRCFHPIVSGDGAFANATGLINFQDNVVDGYADGTAVYTGPISL